MAKSKAQTQAVVEVHSEDVISTEPGSRLLTREEFQGLAQVPPELEWFANIQNERTRQAYQNDLHDFMAFVGIEQPEEFRQVTRAHVIAWRNDLKNRLLSPSTIRRKLSALTSIFDYLCEKNAVPLNPVHGVERPKESANEGKTPALSVDQARRLLKAPPADTPKGKRDRAILATLLYHGLRREELCSLRVKDLRMRRGILHFEIHGKGDKIRFIPVHPKTIVLIQDYLEASGLLAVGEGHTGQMEHLASLKVKDTPLFRPVKNNSTGDLDRRSLQTQCTSASSCDTPKKRESTSMACHPMPCERPLQRPLWKRARTSPRFRTGSAMPMSRPPGSTINAKAGRRRVRHTRSSTTHKKRQVASKNSDLSYNR